MRGFDCFEAFLGYPLCETVLGSFFFPKTPPELGSRLAFWKRGLGARSAGAALSSTRNARFNKNVALVYAKPSPGRPLAVPRALVYQKKTVILT